MSYEEDDEEVTLVLMEGIPIPPVDSTDDLPSPPFDWDPKKRARCYVRDENSFYEWDGESWKARAL